MKRLIIATLAILLLVPVAVANVARVGVQFIPLSLERQLIQALEAIAHSIDSLALMLSIDMVALVVIIFATRRK